MRFERIKRWLTEGETRQEDSIPGFLAKLNEFDLNEYIQAIHFDELKVPSVPFQLPTSKTYLGLKPVSYTHLDVYKRQSQHRTMMRISTTKTVQRPITTTNQFSIVFLLAFGGGRRLIFLKIYDRGFGQRVEFLRGQEIVKAIRFRSAWST